MKCSDLVQYSPFPHEALHKSGMIGLVVSEPYVAYCAGSAVHGIDVVWGNDRGRSYPAGTVCQEFVDELESISGIL